MDVRGFLQAAEERGWLQRVATPVSPRLEMARLIHALGEELTLFEAVEGWPSGVVAGLCGRRRNLALALGVDEQTLLATLVAALRAPSPLEEVATAPCQECVVEAVDLGALPVLTHFAEDGGPYVTSGVLITRDPERGPNAAYHRLMRVGPRSFTARLVEGRGTHRAWARSGGDLPVAVCIGAPLNVQLAAAMSPEPGVDELRIASALAPTPVVRALGSDLLVPAESEIVLEGRLTHDLGDEGTFVDLTRTRDVVRQQPYLIVERITHRREPLYQALLPGGMEHKLLMGLPREPTIYEAVSAVCECTNVAMTPGGGYWLHAVVQIRPLGPEDGRRAIEAAFRGHTSLKHVVVVDEDVDPTDPAAVEWAIATRFQADRDLVVLEEQPSSSLDPSARQVPGEKARTAKMGLDATRPWGADPRAYEVVEYEPVDLARYTIRGDAS
ncbi:MAG: UbiD family decarboxylase [Chloroflexi bacterium]|nr:UbiD family decarboxylase [Chloroflexota bacterium]